MRSEIKPHQAHTVNAISGFVMATGLLLLGSGCNRACRLNDWESAPLTVMTYNVFIDRPNFAAVEAIVREAGTDVVFLQEVTTDWAGTLSGLRDLYPQQECAADEQGRGNVLLSRLPLANVRRVPARFGWHGGWFATVSTSQGEVQVLCVHLKPPLQDNGQFSFGALIDTGPVHRQEIETFANEADLSKPLIVLGDFNENEEGAAARSLKRSRLVSALSQFDVLSPTWTWVDSPFVTARLDHIFHSADLRATYAAVVRGGVSDHQPVVAAFELPQAGVHPPTPSVPSSFASPEEAALGH